VTGNRMRKHEGITGFSPASAPCKPAPDSALGDDGCPDPVSTAPAYAAAPRLVGMLPRPDWLLAVAALELGGGTPASAVTNASRTKELHDLCREGAGQVEEDGALTECIHK
jgi:hypothetical protein